MTNSKPKTPEISSFAAPSKADLAIFKGLSDEEKRQILKAEIEAGLRGTPRKVTPAEIIAAVDARLADA